MMEKQGVVAGEKDVSRQEKKADDKSCCGGSCRTQQPVRSAGNDPLSRIADNVAEATTKK